MEIRKAQRKQAKIKLALQGPSGSGKTTSSLLLASVTFPLTEPFWAQAKWPFSKEIIKKKI